MSNVVVVLLFYVHGKHLRSCREDMSNVIKIFCVVLELSSLHTIAGPGCSMHLQLNYV